MMPGIQKSPNMLGCEEPPDPGDYFVTLGGTHFYPHLNIFCVCVCTHVRVHTHTHLARKRLPRYTVV